MRFADYFGRAFVAVSASQFAWAKMFKESTVSKMVDIPLCHIPEAVIKTAVIGSVKDLMMPWETLFCGV